METQEDILKTQNQETIQTIEKKEEDQQNKEKEVQGRTCLFYLKKKQRYCRLAPKDGGLFCVNHSEDNLIQCPIDPSHSILESNFKKHMRKCQKIQHIKKNESQSWYSEKVNFSNNNKLKEQQEPNQDENGDQNKGDEYSTRLIQSLFYNKSEKLELILRKIPLAFEKAVQLYFDQLKIQNENIAFNNSKELEAYLLDLEESENIILKESLSYQQKHQNQVQKLVDIMEKNNLLNKQYCYIEFGAGKGLLSSGLAQTFKDKFDFKHSSHLLIEREGRKNKFDKNHRDNESWCRLNTDIANFDINQINSIMDEKGFNKYYEGPLNVVGNIKHMCGGATDLSINTLLNIKNSEKQFFKGLMIATCCHQLCTQNTYTNIPFLKEIEFDKDQIDILFHISSWYISIPREASKIKQQLKDEYSKIYQQLQDIYSSSKDNQYSQNNELENKQQELNKQEEETKQISLTPFIDQMENQQRILLGKMTKKIIDIGRVLNIRDTVKGDAQIQKYCDDEFSLENFVIIMK